MCSVSNATVSCLWLRYCEGVHDHIAAFTIIMKAKDPRNPIPFVSVRSIALTTAHWRWHHRYRQKDLWLPRTVEIASPGALLFP